jgi:hypothetical protein
MANYVTGGSRFRNAGRRRRRMVDVLGAQACWDVRLLPIREVQVRFEWVCDS